MVTLGASVADAAPHDQSDLWRHDPLARQLDSVMAGTPADLGYLHLSAAALDMAQVPGRQRTVRVAIAQFSGSSLSIGVESWVLPHFRYCWRIRSGDLALEPECEVLVDGDIAVSCLRSASCPFA